MTIDTTATPLGANPPTDQHPATAPGQGIVHVHTARRYRRQALCTCGYTGKVLDALTPSPVPARNAQQSRLSPALPLRPAPPPVADTLGPTPPTTPSARAPTATTTGMQR